MTNNDSAPPQPPTPAASGAVPVPARKRAAKTPLTPKPAATDIIVAKKIAVTGKIAAKKTARKVPAAQPAITADAASNNNPSATVLVAPTRKRKVTAANPAAVAASADAAATHHPAAAAASLAASTPESPSAPATRRIGRVPGGGAIAPSNAAKPAHTPVGTSTPESAAGPPPQPPAQSAAPVPPQPFPPTGGTHTESRGKRRREKRKQHRNQGQNRNQGNQGNQGYQGHQGHQGNHRQHRQHPSASEVEANRPLVLTGPKVETNGMLELAPKSFGFLRVPKKNFEQARDDVFVPPELIRRHNLRLGQWLHGLYQESSRGPQFVELTQVNGMPPDEAAKLPHFDELKAINPSRRLSFETTPERFTTRIIDIMTPVGRGQRGLIVSPPRSGKTTMLLHTAEAVREKYSDSLHLMVLLIDERPEEVTEFRRALPGAEIYASSNDEVARNHCRIAELAIERAKRLVEAGKDVFLLMDSITRLARAYNATMNNVGRGTGSGGITIGALEVPRRLFAAARNTRGGGSLTILATALIQTNSRADEAIFLEFKGTGNMELVLDRKIAENYIYPAVDIFKSGTRREELLLPEHMLHKIHLIRRGLAGHRPVEAMERLLFFLKKFSNNPQMLLEIKG